MKRVIFLILTLCLLLIFTSVANAVDLSVMGGMFTSEDAEFDFFHNVGYGAGMNIGLTPHLGILGLGEFQQIDENDTYFASVYGTVTLVKFYDIDIQGLIGFEWENVNGGFNKFVSDERQVAIGAIGNYDFYHGLSIWGSTTTVVVSGVPLLNDMRARAGLAYAF